MKLRLETCGRLPRVASPVWIVGLAWAALVLASALLERHFGGPIETCLFLRATGHPCPTCGSTRALLALVHGQAGAAFRWNPLAAVLLPAGFGLVVLRLGFGRRLRFELEPRAGSFLLFAALAALVANWVWVLKAR